MDEKLESAAKYFKHILNLQVAEGSLTKKHEHQIEYRAKHEPRHCSRDATRRSCGTTQSIAYCAMIIQAFFQASQVSWSHKPSGMVQAWVSHFVTSIILS
jgi:hypothetical protein